MLPNPTFDHINMEWFTTNQVINIDNFKTFKCIGIFCLLFGQIKFSTKYLMVMTYTKYFLAYGIWRLLIS